MAPLPLSPLLSFPLLLASPVIAISYEPQPSQPGQGFNGWSRDKTVFRHSSSPNILIRTSYCTIIIVTRHKSAARSQSLDSKLHLVSPHSSHSLPNLSHPVASSSCRAISARRTPCSVVSILPSISAQCSPDCKISTKYHRWRTAAVRSFSDAIVFICAAWSASSSET